MNGWASQAEIDLGRETAGSDPSLPRRHIVINREFFIAGPKEVFGCKLSCTAAFTEKAGEWRRLPGEPRNKDPENEAQKGGGKD